MKTLTESERSTLTNGLYVAADRFKENATTIIAGCDDPPSSDAQRGFYRLRDQFLKQEKESRELAEVIAQAGAVFLAPEPAEGHVWTADENGRVRLLRAR